MKDSTMELKVGIFVFIGFVFLFIIIFSIGDINLFKPTYRVRLSLNFVSGIGTSAPVRLAGVGVGEVEALKIIYDELLNRTRVELLLRIDKGVKIGTDAKATINMLGLMGEKYVEITPGAKKEFLKNNDLLIGHDPATMEAVTGELKNLVASASDVMNKIKNGEGTVGKLLTDETIYNNLEEFTADIKAHPWKLFQKGKEEDNIPQKKTTATQGNKGSVSSKNK